MKELLKIFCNIKQFRAVALGCLFVFRELETRAILIVFLCIQLTSCTTASYHGYVNIKYPPKPKNYNIPFYDNAPDFGKRYTIIGKLDVKGDTYEFANWNAIYNKAKAVAREKGADAVINVETSSKQYKKGKIISGYTSHEKIVTYHSGTQTSNANIYGDVQGSIHGTGSYSGTSTTYIPVHHPPEIVITQGEILNHTGQLIVFEKAVFEIDGYSVTLEGNEDTNSDGRPDRAYFKRGNQEGLLEDVDFDGKFDTGTIYENGVVIDKVDF